MVISICTRCCSLRQLSCKLARRILIHTAQTQHVLQRNMSTLPYLSDRDQTQEEALSVNKYISKNHKRRTMLFVCGLNTTGALGIPKHRVMKLASSSEKGGYFNYPYRLSLGNVKVTTVDCGYGYTVFASNHNDLIKVWGMGINTESQLGFHKSRNKPSKRHPDVTGYFDFIIEPTPIPIPFDNFAKTKVIQVACGRAHTLVLTDDEGIFTFGNNAFGQCGRRIIEGEMYQGSRKIHRIPHDIFSSPVKNISCGMDHSLFLTQSGQVYGCGWGADGQTGIGTYKKSSKPTLLKGDLEGAKVKQICTFADMSLAVCEEGHLYGWGNSEYFQLASVTDGTQVCSPKKLPFSEVGKIVSAASGGSICCLLNENGEVWVWGYGILGKGPDLRDAIHPQKIPMTLFGQSVFSPNVTVIKVKCGMGHFAAVTNQGELYTWGKNKHGCLGIGANRDQYFPWRVLMPGEIFDVYCGVDHAVVLSKSML